MKEYKTKKYKITRTETYDYGDGNIQTYEKIYYRSAVSEKQAISRIKWINGDNKWNMVHEFSGDGALIITYKAEEVDKNE